MLRISKRLYWISPMWTISWEKRLAESFLKNTSLGYDNIGDSIRVWLLLWLVETSNLCLQWYPYSLSRQISLQCSGGALGGALLDLPETLVLQSARFKAHAHSTAQDSQTVSDLNLQQVEMNMWYYTDVPIWMMFHMDKYYLLCFAVGSGFPV